MHSCWSSLFILGGKHNDLEDVGKDLYHHTFFEMLGNWSFGDYFKKEAIHLAWTLLTKIYNMDPNRLYVTYFGGDISLGLDEDLEAKQIWLDLGLDPSHIIPFGPKENFWEMGETGPCGPCSEIHYDRIGSRNAASLVNTDDPNVLEIWNLVFMQFNREANQSLRPLPNKHIDTGAGLERVLSVLQDKESNYDTDAFKGLFDKIQALSGAREYKGLVGAEDVDGIDTAYRVIADHIRTLTFAISDSCLPSNEGRGYVLRRILRRAARYVHQKLKTPLGTFFSTLVDTVFTEMSGFYTELNGKSELVKRILNEEEQGFAKTLERGERQFDNFVADAKQRNTNILSGPDAWKLYDTYGFPVDLTRLMASEIGFAVDEEGFLVEQNIAREKSRNVKADVAEVVALDVHTIAEIEHNVNVEKTNDSFKYEPTPLNASIKAIYADGKFVESLEDFKGRFGVILDKTNFYAEAGGQQSDQGTISSSSAEFIVEDVQIFAGYVLHIGMIRHGKLSLDQQVLSTINEDRRNPIMSNHTSTHILNYALLKTLGEGIDQKGSLVTPTKLRFDFSYTAAIQAHQITEIENIVSEVIRQSLPVNNAVVSLQEAKSISGLRAVFGEVYPDPVRVVVIGHDVKTVLLEPVNDAWRKTSIEFCGGTHVANTSEIESFAILEESSIAKGIRRIVGCTGAEARLATQVADKLEKELDAIGGANAEAELKVLTKYLDECTIPAVRKHGLRQKAAALKKVFVEADKERKNKEVKETLDLVKSVLDDENVSYAVMDLKVGTNTKAISTAIQHVKSLNKSAMFLSTDNEKVIYFAVAAKSHIEKGLKASEWVTAVAEKLGGKSGGKEDAAQGAGNNVLNMQEAISVAEDFAKMRI